MGLFGPKDDPPHVKLTYWILKTVIDTRTACFRVTRARGVEAYDGRGWEPIAEYRTMPEKLRLPVIQRLREMSGSAGSVDYGNWFELRLEDQVHAFDVCYARGESTAAVVVSMFPAREDVPSDPERWRRAMALLEQANGAKTRDEVLARIREALALVPEGDGVRHHALRLAADACARTGLYEVAIDHYARALPSFDVRDRIGIDLDMGTTLENAHRLEEAARCYERALANAQSLGPARQIIPVDSLACVCLERDELDAAERHLARAEALSADAFGLGAASELTLRTSRVRILRKRGENAAAEIIAQDTFDQAERFGVSDVADGLRYELGLLALERADAKTAAKHFRKLLAEPSLHPMRALAFVRLAQALGALGKRSDALAALRSAAVIADGALAHDHPTRVDLERELALHGATSPYRGS